MSIHKSLKVKNRHVRRRNVLSREERLEHLQKQERWSDGDSIFGLPKVLGHVKVPRRGGKEKEKVKAKGAEAAVEGAETQAPEQRAAKE
jgi:small basic protein (TIGR04137 family)